MKTQGFTLVELLVVLGIAAILATLGVPVMKDMLENNRLRAASEELYQRMYLAKSQAIDLQKNMFVYFATGTNWCYGLNSIVTCNCNVVNNCNHGAVTNTNNQISLAITGFTGTQAQINSGRGTLANSGAATFSLNGKSITINASRMGRISICSDTIGGYKGC